jgi:hypothetical protein
LVSVSDAFQEYRFTKVNVRAWMQSTATLATTLGVAFTPNILTVGPAAIADLQNLEDCAYGNGGFGNPWPKLVLGPRQLLAGGPVKWWRRGTTYDDTLEKQGTVYYAAQGNFSSALAFVLIEYDVEFRTSADTAETVSHAARDPPPLAVLWGQLQQIQRTIGISQVSVALRPDSEQKGGGDVTDAVPEEDYVVADEPPPTAVARPPVGVPPGSTPTRRASRV